MCLRSIASILSTVCPPLVSFPTASVPVSVFFFFVLLCPFPLCRSLSVAFYIFFPHFCLLPSLFSRQWAMCSLLHVDTLAPPRSRHNWPPGFVLVHSTHTHTHTHTGAKVPDAERERQKKAEQKKKKSETGREEEEW